MFKKTWLILSQAAEKYRLVLWILLLLLTMAILLFPVHLEYEYHTVQSPYIFGNNLPFFCALFYIWMFLLLALIFSRRDAKWEKLALVCLFAVVFLGFWAIITPYFKHQDEWYNAAHVQYILQEGRIPLTHWYLGYFQWPGLHLTALTLCQITGLSILKVRTLFAIFEVLLLSTLFYVLLLRLLKNPAISAIGVVLLILGNILIGKWIPFHPDSFGPLLLLPLFLILLNRHEHTLLETWQDRLLMFIVLVAITITHFITSVALVLILVGIYLVQKIGKEPPLTSASFIGLTVVVVLTWEMYWAISTFRELTGIFTIMLYRISFYNIFLSAEVAMGARTSPLWATGVRLFWWVFVYGFGSILWLRSLFRLKKLTPLEKRVLGGFGGIIVLTIILTLAGQGGLQLVRFLKYAPFFTIPIILHFFLNLGNYKRRYSIAFLAILLFVLSLPTMFVYKNMINIGSFYPSEVSTSKFMKATYGEGEGLIIYASTFHGTLNAYYLPKARISGSADPIYLEDKNDLWAALGLQLQRFEDWYGDREYSVYVYSKRLVGSYLHIFGFEPTHNEWIQVQIRLSDKNKVYDNGDCEIYIPAKPRPPLEEVVVGN